MCEWTREINNLIYINRGLNMKERNLIKKMLKVYDLRIFVNLRYAVDPLRYDMMNKNELVNELKYSRYEE